jgi:thiol reductant ABC exporter CydC subunit
MTGRSRPRDPLLRLVPHLRAHRGLFGLTVLAGVATQALAIGLATASAWLVGTALSGGRRAELVPGLAVLGACAVLQAVAAWAEQWVAHEYAFQVIARLRVQVYDGMERTAPAMLLERRSGDVAAAVMADAESLELFYAHTAPSYLVAVLVPGAALVALALVHPAVAGVAGAFSALLLVLPFVLAGRAARQGQALRSQVGALNAEVVDAVQGLRELTTFGRGQAQLERLRGHARRLFDAQSVYGRRVGTELAAVDALLALATVATLVVAGFLAERGTLTPTAFLVAVILAGSALAPVVLATATAAQLGQVRGSAQRVFAVIDAPANVLDGGTAALPPADLVPQVRFEEVGFGYVPGRPVLRDVSLNVEPGETVALVGASGAGKTTCTHLLARFWDPDRGRIRLGERDLRELPLATLRRLVGFVPQDTYLFRASVLENLRLGRPDASLETVEAAARAAQAHDFILALPRGYDTVISERGLSLSGGQRQRLAIARALVLDPPVLVLDEAVSNLDAEHERLLRAALETARSGRTTLLIAHRLSTILSADRVVMLAAGRVVADGPPRRLLREGGPFAALVGVPTSRRSRGRGYCDRPDNGVR